MIVKIEFFCQYHYDKCLITMIMEIFSILKAQKSQEFVSFTGESKEYQEPAEFTSLRNTTIDF